MIAVWFDIFLMVCLVALAAGLVSTSSAPFKISGVVLGSGCGLQLLRNIAVITGGSGYWIFDTGWPVWIVKDLGFAIVCCVAVYAHFHSVINITGLWRPHEYKRSE